MDSHLASKIVPYIVPLLVLALVTLRLVRNPPRKITPHRLFITPLLLAFATYITLRQTPAPGMIWMVVDALAIAAGTGVGYLSARHREFRLDSQSGEIMSRATPLGTLIFGALFAARFSLKLAFPQLNTPQTFALPAGMAHPSGSLIGWADAGLIFSTAMLIATATTIWLRTRQLVAQQNAATVEQSKPSV